MKIFTPSIVTTSDILAKAMIDVGLNGHTKKLLNNKEINSLMQSRVSNEKIS